MKKLERDPTVGYLDTNIFSRYSGPVGEMAQTGRRGRVVPIPRNSMENSLQKHVKKFQRDPTIGSLDTNLLNRYSSLVGGMTPTVHHQRVVPISHNSMENSLLNYIKQFERNPTVGSLDTDFLSRYSGPFGGMARPDTVGG